MSLFTRIIDLQKLHQAWSHVKKNKPAPGVDNVTYEMFEERKNEALKQLQIELRQNSYEPLPVRKVMIYKEEKARTIALYSMRDKVVQQSLAFELNKMFNNQFTPSTYAYRNNMSALTALDRIVQEIGTGKYHAVLKVDIRHFFDTIRLDYLEKILRRFITEEDVLELILKNCNTKELTEDGELVEQFVGLNQGSGIAPILSNIYLMDFDKWLLENSCFFVRYSDDILILGENKEKLLSLLSEIKKQLYALGLEINEKKSRCLMLEEGIDFLGHHFDNNGKSIPQKAKESLKERLEIMWLTSGVEFEEKISKANSIIGGWEQYFKEDREIESIFEFLSVLTMSQKDSEYRKILIEKRHNVKNVYKDITMYLADIWRKYNVEEMELYEYEEFYGLPTELNHDNSLIIRQILEYYRRFIINEDCDVALELMQLYTDLHEYNKAAWWQDKMQMIQSASKNKEVSIIPDAKEYNKTITFDQATINRMMKHFVGREDVYALESLAKGGKRQVETILLPLTEDKLKEHLSGNITLGSYLQRPNNTVKFIVIDVDVSKRILLQYDRDTQEFQEYLVNARKVANEILHMYRNWGLEGYVEYSGSRGFHVWLLFTEWIPVRYARMFCELVERKQRKEEGISIDYFPNNSRIRAGKYGQYMKLPFGYHVRTGELSYFINEDGSMIYDINAFMDTLARFQLVALKKILAANTELTEQGNQNIEFDIKPFGDIPASVKSVLENCNLMKYLCQKANRTGYLTHFERQSILYVFGHLGDEGKEFIHTVMKMTLNYQYQVTQKFITKMPEKPISCVKLRDQYKSVTAEYGCSCSFKRAKNCYPSPVLHAISLTTESDAEITIPTSRTLSKEKEQKVMDEMNIHRKAEELAGKILDLKKQRRKLDSNIRKIESELGKIYDSEGIDCLEIEMGLLVRRKTDIGYEWIIEI